MSHRVFEWWPVRDSRKARFFWGIQMFLGLWWTGRGMFGDDRVFRYLGPVFIVLTLVGILRPRFVLQSDLLWWRAFGRKRQVALADIDVIRLRPVSDFALRRMDVITKAGEKIGVSTDALGWDDEQSRQPLMAALDTAAERHGFRVEKPNSVSDV